MVMTEYAITEDVELEQYRRYMAQRQGCGPVSLMCAVLTVGAVLAAVLPVVAR